MFLRVLFVVATALTALVGSAAAAPPPGTPTPFGRQIAAEVKHDVGPALRDLPPAARAAGQRVVPLRRLPAPALINPGGQTVAPAGAVPNALTIPPTSSNFDGVGQGFSGPQGTFPVTSAPPDTNGSVGPNHFVQIVNTDFAVFNKAGGVLFGPVPINTLWSGFGGGCQTNNDGDPSVVYDRMADRWVVTQFSVSTTPFLECLAVSTTGDPTGSYNRYSFSYANFPDYPKLSVWPDAYYVTYNMFNATGSVFLGSEVCALDRGRMILGQAATQQCFDVGTGFGGLLTSALDSAMLPPAGSPNYVLALGATNTSLAAWKFHVDWVTPANTTLTRAPDVAIASYTQACGGGTCIPQAGTTQQLDSLGDRLMYRLAYRNFGDHEALVTNHSVTVGASVGVRWYELRINAGDPVLFQQGTYAPDSSFRWMGSAALDGAGDIALGFSVSSSSLHPGVGYTARLASDPAGQMTRGEGTIMTGAGSQSGQALSRWGDYSSLAVDPADDCTFWYTNEYEAATGAFNWHTRVGSFKLAGCAPPANDFSIGVSPTALSVAQGGSGTATVSTALTNGAAQTINLSVSGVPAGATATFTPTSVSSGGSSTLSVSAGTAAAGTYTLGITGTGASATHATSLTLTVTAPPPANDFSIAVSPTALSVAQAGSGTTSVSTALTAGVAQTINLSVSGVPAGATATFTPTSVSSGGSSTLSVSAGTAAAGTYTLGITGTGASATHTTSLTLTVTAPAPAAGAGIVNGGFETGDLSGWTSTGTASVSTISHSGSFSAMLGSSLPTNGDSTLSQTFTAPAGGGNLVFWFRIVCPDSVNFDWATVTLRDNTTAVTTTVLPRTCTNLGAWVRASSALTGGDSYTLTLVNHDDNRSADPTFTNYDDVAIVVPIAGITNGGFETGGLGGWTTAGLTAVNTNSHTGAFAAQVGSTAAFNGDSSISQTFTAGAGATQLVFWYDIVCLDSVTFDWATATLTDNTTGVATTVLPRTCTNTGVYAQATATVISGHSYTLTLVDHDDGFAADPTFTLVDDVGLQ